MGLHGRMCAACVLAHVLASCLEEGATHQLFNVMGAAGSAHVMFLKHKKFYE